VPDCLWIDATHGAAGDMILAALLDAGADLRAVNDSLSRLAVEPVRVTLDDVRRHGLRAKLATVVTPTSTTRRHLSDVLQVISDAHLAAPVEQFAVATFKALAEAEGRVHGIASSEVHFHEVGALDAIADVVGCGAALADLGLLDEGTYVTVSAVAVGSGTARAEHGRVPVPVPAVVELLSSAGASVHGGGPAQELCTPTAAAILTTLAAAWGNCPPMTLTASGTGAGTTDPPAHTNITRVLIGTADRAEIRPIVTDLVVVESTVDDLEPRLLPGVLDAIYLAGALDAWATPAAMRKGRTGQTISALTRPEDLEPVFAAFVRHSPTLGVRSYPVRRTALQRDRIAVVVDGHEISVKRGWLGRRIVTTQPEFEDVARAAAALGLPQGIVLTRARVEAATVVDD
jgi:uncharacterized protein (TIGR00299 family) protein